MRLSLIPFKIKGGWKWLLGAIANRGHLYIQRNGHTKTTLLKPREVLSVPYYRDVPYKEGFLGILQSLPYHAFYQIPLLVTESGLISWAFTAGGIWCIKYPSETAASKCLLGSVLVKSPVCVLGESHWALCVLVSGLALLGYVPDINWSCTGKREVIGSFNGLPLFWMEILDSEMENKCTENYHKYKGKLPYEKIMSENHLPFDRQWTSTYCCNK